MFANGKMKQKLADQYILLDGTELKSNPAKVIIDLEKRIFGNSSFYKNEYFVKQSNGLFCFKWVFEIKECSSYIFRKESESKICMPKSKGRSVDKIMKSSTKSKLDHFYSKSLTEYNYKTD